MVVRILYQRGSDAYGMSFEDHPDSSHVYWNVVNRVFSGRFV